MNFKTLQTSTAHPLMQPNPTSYQFYLLQGGDKLYWHKVAPDWQANRNKLELDRDKSDDNGLLGALMMIFDCLTDWQDNAKTRPSWMTVAGVKNMDVFTAGQSTFLFATFSLVPAKKK